ncbi:MAG TPA: nitrous oxide reductase accessory protein NosL [Desulfosarcina sp.]|nr:nitrous oxide reductase accessory protein NosL [Desulfosarcina sp.]
MQIHAGFKRSAALIVLLLAGCLAADTCIAEEVCFHCGMTRAQYGRSWVIIEEDDGRRTGVCSVHCAAIDLVLNKDTLVNKITVGDYLTEEQIDAYKAYWVIGGDLPGVMTANAKWAFREEADAKTFIRKHGGRQAVFEEVIRTAFEDLYEDTMAIKRRKIMKEMESNAANGSAHE